MEENQPRNLCILHFHPQMRVLRPAQHSDLPAVLAIEQSSFPLPWTEAAFYSEFGNPYSFMWVLEEQTLIIGYICTWFIHDEGQIVKIAVLPRYRRGGFGSMLIRHVLQEAGKKQIRLLSLEVRSSNQAALELYTKFGFQRTAVRKCYYENGEDAWLMVCAISCLPQ